MRIHVLLPVMVNLGRLHAFDHMRLGGGKTRHDYCHNELHAADESVDERIVPRGGYHDEKYVETPEQRSLRVCPCVAWREVDFQELFHDEERQHRYYVRVAQMPITVEYVVHCRRCSIDPQLTLQHGDKRLNRDQRYGINGRPKPLISVNNVASTTRQKARRVYDGTAYEE